MRDSESLETSIVFLHYSLIVTGSLERVLELFRDHNVPIQRSDFHADKGYIFMLRPGSENGTALLEALDNCDDVIAVSSMYGQRIEEYVAFCQHSLVPVEVGFEL